LDTPEVGVSKNDWDFRGRMVEVSGFWLRSGFKSQRDSLDISGYIEQAMFCWLKGTGTVMATLRPKDARGLRDVPIEMLSCIGGFFSILLWQGAPEWGKLGCAGCSQCLQGSSSWPGIFRATNWLIFQKATDQNHANS
jgi:hypothetical protein